MVFQNCNNLLLAFEPCSDFSLALTSVPGIQPRLAVPPKGTLCSPEVTSSHFSPGSLPWSQGGAVRHVCVVPFVIQHIPAEPDLCITHSVENPCKLSQVTWQSMPHLGTFRNFSFKGWSPAYLLSGLSSQNLWHFSSIQLTHGFKEATALLWVASHVWFQQPGTGLVSGAILGIR